VLVQPGIDPHVAGSHLLLGELLHLLDGAGSTVLEANSMQSFVEIDGVLASDDLTHGGPLLLTLRHFEVLQRNKRMNLMT
jgi:hypothetical protein